MGKLLDAAILFLYPLIVFCGITFLGIRWTAVLLLLLAGRRVITSVLSSRSTSRIVIIQASAMAAIMGAAALAQSAFALRVTPFAISLTFIAMFALSLRNTPIIERFARLKKPDLPPDHVAYCRSLTKVWIGVLIWNSGLVLAASFLEDEAMWAVMVGPVSYGWLGSVFTIEYLIRKRKFQEFDDNPIDRLLKPILGPKAQSR
jgi:uncharacterized membrane protein